MKKAKPWKKISSRVILDHPMFKINEDLVELPDGKRVSCVLQAPTDTHSVIILAINEKGELLIQREYSYPPNEVMWQLPGGAMESGESVLQSAQRELSEESGYAAKAAKELGYFYVQNRKSNRKQYVVVCSELYENKLEEDHDEFIESYWISVDEIHQMIRRGEFSNINLLATLNMWFHNEDSK